MKLMSRVLSFILVFILVFSFNIQQVNASVTYGSAEFLAISSYGLSLSDGNFKFTSDDEFEDYVAVDQYGVYPASSAGNPSDSQDAIITIESANAGSVFVFESVKVNTQGANRFLFEITLNDDPTIVGSAYVSNTPGEYDTINSGWNYKLMSITPTVANKVHIHITGTSSVGQNTSIFEFTIGALPAPAAPEMNVVGNGNTIMDGDNSPSTSDFTDFGDVAVSGGQVTRTFTVMNSGTGTLSLNGTPKVSIGGADAADFSVSAVPSGTINANDSTIFQITFDPSTAGTKSASISVANDDSDENPYNFNITGNATVMPEMNIQGNGNTIADGDLTPSLTDHSNFGTVDISGGSIDRTFTIQNTADGILTLTGSKVTITGADAADYSVITQPANTVAPGGTSDFVIRFNPSAVGIRSATINVANDDSDENPYNFNIQGTGFEPTVTIGLVDSPFVENAGSATVTATLSGTYGQNVTINFSFSGTATGAGIDYSVSGSSITIPAGQTTGSMTVTGVSDSVDEDDETVIVDISSVTNGAESGTQQVTATITDDDAAPSLSIDDPSVMEGDAGTTTLTYTVTMSTASARTVSVDYATANGTAQTADGDYVAKSGTLSFAAGETNKTISVTINGDTADEGSESVLLNLTNPTNSTIADTQGSGTITNDDTPLISVDDVTVNEGDAGTTTFSFTVSLSTAAGPGGVTFDIATANGTANTGTDYTAKSLTSQTIPEGSSTYTFDVLVNGDITYEANDTFLVNISNASGGTLSDAQGQGTITNDDAQPMVSLSLSGSPVAENAGTVTVTATLASPSSQAVTVDLGYTGTATNGTDYNVSATSIVIAAGQTTGTATITTETDTTDENDETVIVDITYVTNGTEDGSQQVTATISDDDALPTLSIDDPSITEGDAGTVNLQYTVTLSAASGKTVTVDYTTADGTATSAGGDYATTSGTITFNPGQITKIITVVISGDTLEENSETVLVNLSGSSNATIADSEGSGTITNDEADTTVPVFGGGGIITIGSVTSGTIDLSWSAASDNITLPSNLQYKVVLSFSSNITTVVDAESNGTVAQDWTSNLMSKQATGLSPSTLYYFNIIVKDESGNKTIYTTASTTTNETQNIPNTNIGTVVVIVNGQIENAGTETKTEENGRTTVTVEVNKEVIDEKIDEAITNNPEGTDNILQVPISDVTSEVAKIELTGDIIKKLETNNFEVSIVRDDIEYIVPAEEFTISDVAEELGISEEELQDIQIEVKISKLDASVVAAYEKVVVENGGQLVFPPVEFEIVAKATAADGTKSVVEISRFNNYVERVMEIPEGIDPSKITTGIVFNTDGTYSHVPTVVFQNDGKWYAKLSSLTNSSYSVVWNPVTVASVATHWAKTAVNNLASRLVIDHPESFNPDQAITRAEFAQYIVKALGLYREDFKGTIHFKDVNLTNELFTAVAIAQDYGILAGYEDGTFKPDRLITREEAMVMYARAMKITKLIGSDLERFKGYTDYQLVSEWAQGSVKDVISAHVFNGTSSSKLSLKSKLTFAEAAQAIQNLLVESKLINK